MKKGCKLDCESSSQKLFIQSHPSFGFLYVKKLRNNAAVPKKGSEEAAGYDIASAEDTVVPAKGKTVVKTGISVAIPEGCYGRIAPRSGLAVKRFIDVGAGVIDADYRGEIGVVLFNHSDEDFVVKSGDRIAQLILEKIETPTVKLKNYQIRREEQMVLEVLALVMKKSENHHVYRYYKEWTENPELRIRTHVVFSVNSSALKRCRN